MQRLAWTELRLAGQRRMFAVALSIMSVAAHPAEVISKGDRQSRLAGSAGQWQLTQSLSMPNLARDRLSISR